MLKQALLISSILLSSAAYSASCPEANIPNNARYDQRTFSWVTDFRLKDQDRDGEKVANIRRVPFNTIKTILKKGELAGARFNYNVNDKSLSKDKRLSFYGEQTIQNLKDAIIIRVRVKDCNGNLIGTVVETLENKAAQIGTEILEEAIKVISLIVTEGEESLNVNLSNMWSKYEILDAQGKKIATSESNKFINENITITANNGSTMSMKMKGFDFDFGDDWYAEFSSNDTGIDSRILALLPAFKTYKNNQENLSDMLED